MCVDDDGRAASCHRPGRRLGRWQAYIGLAAVAAVIGLPVQPSFASSRHRGADDRGQVLALFGRIAKGLSTRNANLAASAYSRDDFVLYDFIPPIRDQGWQRLRAKYAAFMDQTDGAVGIVWTDQRLDVDRRLAYFRGIAHLRARYKDGRQVSGPYRYTAIVQKVRGNWAIVHEHSSVPANSLALKDFLQSGSR